MKFPTWGGRRAGAGRKPAGARAGVLHVTRPTLRREHPVHVTLRVVAGLPSLRNRAWLPAYERAFAAERERLGFRLCHYAVLENHFHLVCEADDRRALWRGVQRLCIRLARRINKTLGRSGRVFADRYHRRTATTPTQTRNMLAYVVLNHQHHAAQRCVSTMIEADPFSSARGFDGWRRPISAGRFALGPPPVARPRGWLLSTGWRRARRGLIAPTEVPGS